MTEPNAAIAAMLEASAPGYAAAAANSLLTHNDALSADYGAGATASWKAYFVQRLQELAAAVRAGEPQLFVGRVLWQQKAFNAREADPQDVRRSLLRLKETLAAELPDHVREAVTEHLEQGLKALTEAEATGAAALEPKDAASALALSYIAACLEGNPRHAIGLIMEAARAGQPAETLYLRVLVPAQREIGRMWHDAQATVAEEHLVTETTRRAMALLSHEYATEAQIGKTVLAAGVAGNAHDMGIRALADLFELGGWRTIFLGADVPAADMASAVQLFEPDLVVLGTTLTTQLKPLRATIDVIRSTCGDGVKILVGGTAFADAPTVWQHVGADGFAADLDTALGTALELVGLSQAP